SSPLLDCLRGFDWPTDKDVALFLESVPKEWDVSIQYTGAAATAFPWEAGLRPDPRRFICRSLEAGSGLTETVMWVQTALRSLGTGVQVDGVLGPRTRAAIREMVGNVEPYRITPMLAEALRRQGKAEPKFLVLRAELELE